MVEYDHRLAPTAANGRLHVVEPASGSVVTLGVAADGRGGLKLYAGARAPQEAARTLGSRLGRALGTVQVIPVGDAIEVRRWSPYRIEDIERTPAEADDWATSTLQTLLEELVPPGPSAQLSFRRTGPAMPTVPAVPDDTVAGIESRTSAEGGTPGPRTALVPGPNPLTTVHDPYQDELSLVRTQLSAAREQLDRVNALLYQAARERDAAVAQVRETEEARGTHQASTDLVPPLLASLELMTDAGGRPSTSVAVLQQYLRLAPEEPRLLEALGISQLRDDQVGAAMATLRALGPEGLTPRGASAYVEASLRQRALPEPLDVVGRVDWRVGTVAQQLRELPRWAPSESLIDVATRVSQNAPPDFDSFLVECARAAGRDQMHHLFELWFDRDPNVALGQVVEWVGTDRVQVAQTWVRDAVRLAVDSEDRRTGRAALDILAEDAERRKAPGALLDVIESARGLLRPADWRVFTVRWLRELTGLSSDKETIDRAAVLMLDLLKDLPSVRDDDAEYAVAMILERRANGPLAGALRIELARLRPVDVTVWDVTTVSEALAAARQRHPALIVLPDAERSAAKRGTVGVKKAREALFQLGEIAERYAAGELDEGLDRALAALPDFKPDVSDTAKQRHAQQYTKTLPDGSKVLLGPHFDIGGTDGRAYLFIDRGRRRIVLGHCGDHLAGKRDG